MKAYFQKLYQYNQWANSGLCKHLKKLNDQSAEVMKRMSHIVAAEEIWYNRIKPLGFDHLPLFDVQPWEVLEPRLTSSAQRLLDLLQGMEDFGVEIRYSNLAGKSFASSLSDILIHLANHGTYHRGQIATLLRQQGLEPLPTDYIFYCREHVA